LNLTDRHAWKEFKKFTGGRQCFTAADITQWGKDLFIDWAMSQSTNDTSAERVKLIVGSLIDQLFQVLESTRSEAYAYKFKMCFGSLTGAEIRGGSELATSLSDMKCNLIPLNTKETFGFMGLQVPVSPTFMNSMCPSWVPGVEYNKIKTLSFCVAYAGCWITKDVALPTLGIGMDTNFASCILKNDAFVAATEGASMLAAYGLRASDYDNSGVAFGTSLTGDLSTKVTLYHGGADLATANIRGNLGMQVKIKAGPFMAMCQGDSPQSSALCDILTISGSLELMLGVYQSNAEESEECSSSRCGSDEVSAGKICGQVCSSDADCTSAKAPKCFHNLDKTPALMDDKGVVVYTPENIWGLTAAIKLRNRLSIDLTKACGKAVCKALPKFKLDLIDVYGAFSGVSFAAKSKSTGDALTLQPGLYVYLESFSLKAMVDAVLGNLIGYFGGILDGVFGVGTMKKALNWLQGLNLPDEKNSAGLYVTLSEGRWAFQAHFDIYGTFFEFGFGWKPEAKQAGRALAADAKQARRALEAATSSQTPFVTFNTNILNLAMQALEAVAEWAGALACWVVKQGGQVVKAVAADLLRWGGDAVDRVAGWATDAVDQTALAVRYLVGKDSALGKWAQHHIWSTLGDLTDEAKRKLEAATRKLLEGAGVVVDHLEGWLQDHIWSHLEARFRPMCTMAKKPDLYRPDGTPKEFSGSLAQCCMEACHHENAPFHMWTCAAQADKACVDNCLCLAKHEDLFKTPPKIKDQCEFGNIDCSADDDMVLERNCACSNCGFLDAERCLDRDYCNAPGEDSYRPKMSGTGWGSCSCHCVQK